MRIIQAPRKMFRYLLVLLMIMGGTLFLSRDIHAQIRADAPYVLPHTVFVGDRGRLVVPLDPAFAGIAPFVKEGESELPQVADLLIRRIELERRGGISRLLIDFIPYATGTINLPPLEFLFPGEDEEEETMALPPLSVQVTSILGPGNMALSQPASPLAVPGTTLLVYGTGILILVLLSLGIGFSLLGPRYFREFWERIRRRYRLRITMRFLRRLKHECGLDKSANPGQYLTVLSAKTREFLTFLTGFNCQSLTAMEFLDLPLEEEAALNPGQLYSLFRAWDTLRFSGQDLEMKDLFKAIDDVNALITALDRAEKEKLLPKPLAAPKISTGGSV